MTRDEIFTELCRIRSVANITPPYYTVVGWGMGMLLDKGSKAACTLRRVIVRANERDDVIRRLATKMYAIEPVASQRVLSAV